MSIDAKDLQLRSLKSLKDNALLSTSKQLGSIYQSLINLELNRIVVDELHLLLQISDKLIDNMVTRAAELDHRDYVFGNTSRSITHIEELQSATISCGVYFKVNYTVKMLMNLVAS